MLKHCKQEIKDEQNRYKYPINPFSIGDKVVLVHNLKEDICGEITKINIKTYTVTDAHGDKYRVDKLSLIGMWTELIDGVGVNSRMRVGENVRMQLVFKKNNPKKEK